MKRYDKYSLLEPWEEGREDGPLILRYEICGPVHAWVEKEAAPFDLLDLHADCTAVDVGGRRHGEEEASSL